MIGLFTGVISEHSPVRGKRVKLCCAFFQEQRRKHLISKGKAFLPNSDLTEVTSQGNNEPHLDRPSADVHVQPDALQDVGDDAVRQMGISVRPRFDADIGLFIRLAFIRIIQRNHRRVARPVLLDVIGDQLFRVQDRPAKLRPVDTTMCTGKCQVRVCPGDIVVRVISVRSIYSAAKRFGLVRGPIQELPVSGSCQRKETYNAVSLAVVTSRGRESEAIGVELARWDQHATTMQHRPTNLDEGMVAHFIELVWRCRTVGCLQGHS